MSVHGERFLRFSIAEIRQIGANSFAFPPFSFSRASSRAVYPSSSLKLLYASNWDTCQLELVTVAREKGWKGCRGRGRGKKKIERGGSKDPSIDRRGEEETCPRQGIELPVVFASALFSFFSRVEAATHNLSGAGASRPDEA